MNGHINGFDWVFFHPYKWNCFTLFITGVWAHFATLGCLVFLLFRRSVWTWATRCLSTLKRQWIRSWKPFPICILVKILILSKTMQVRTIGFGWDEHIYHQSIRKKHKQICFFEFIDFISWVIMCTLDTMKIWNQPQSGNILSHSQQIKMFVVKMQPINPPGNDPRSHIPTMPACLSRWWFSALPFQWDMCQGLNSHYFHIYNLVKL